MENRKTQVQELLDQNLSNRQISQKIGISFQRVSQIRQTLGPKYKYQFVPKNGPKKCAYAGCKKKSFLPTKGPNQKFCSTKCYQDWRKSPIPLKERTRIKVNKYYHEVFKKKPDWKKIKKAHNDKYYKKTFKKGK